MKNLLKSIVVVITVVVAMFTVNAVVDYKEYTSNKEEVVTVATDVIAVITDAKMAQYDEVLEVLNIVSRTEPELELNADEKIVTSCLRGGSIGIKTGYVVTSVSADNLKYERKLNVERLARGESVKFDYLDQAISLINTLNDNIEISTCGGFYADVNGIVLDSYDFINPNELKYLNGQEDVDRISNYVDIIIANHMELFYQ